MKKTLLTLGAMGAGLFAGSLLMYWFNLDNKAIYYAVRPIMNKLYAKQQRDVRL